MAYASKAVATAVQRCTSRLPCSAADMYSTSTRVPAAVRSMGGLAPPLHGATAHCLPHTHTHTRTRTRTPQRQRHQTHSKRHCPPSHTAAATTHPQCYPLTLYTLATSATAHTTRALPHQFGFARRHQVTSTGTAGASTTTNNANDNGDDDENPWDSAVLDAEMLVGPLTSLGGVRNLLGDELENVGVFTKRLLESGHPLLKNTRKGKAAMARASLTWCAARPRRVCVLLCSIAGVDLAVCAAQAACVLLGLCVTRWQHDDLRCRCWAHGHGIGHLLDATNATQLRGITVLVR